MAIFLSVGPAGLAAAPAFQVVGNVRSTSYYGGVEKGFTSTFRAQVEGCKVLIKSTVLDEEARVREYFSEGSNSMIVVHYPDTLITNTTLRSLGKWSDVELKKPEHAWNQGTVLVRPDVLPQYGFEYMAVVWLAYGSKCYYAKSGEGQVPPVVHVGDGFRENHRVVNSVWNLNSSPPGMLDFMAEFNDGKRYSRQDSAFIVQDLPSPFNSGFTNAIYRTLEWTNLGGLMYPRRFELIRFEPDIAAVTNKQLNVLYKCEGIAVDFYSDSGTNMAPDIPLRSRVVDYTSARPSESAYTYLVTNGQVLDKKQIEARMAIRPTYRVEPGTARLFLAVILAMALILPFLIFHRKKS